MDILIVSTPSLVTAEADVGGCRVGPEPLHHSQFFHFTYGILCFVCKSSIGYVNTKIVVQKQKFCFSLSLWLSPSSGIPNPKQSNQPIRFPLSKHCLPSYHSLGVIIQCLWAPSRGASGPLFTMHFCEVHTLWLELATTCGSDQVAQDA